MKTITQKNRELGKRATVETIVWLSLGVIFAALAFLFSNVNTFAA